MKKAFLWIFLIATMWLLSKSLSATPNDKVMFAVGAVLTGVMTGYCLTPSKKIRYSNDHGPFVYASNIRFEPKDNGYCYIYDYALNREVLHYTCDAMVLCDGKQVECEQAISIRGAKGIGQGWWLDDEGYFHKGMVEILVPAKAMGYEEAENIRNAEPSAAAKTAGKVSEWVFGALSFVLIALCAYYCVFLAVAALFGLFYLGASLFWSVTPGFFASIPTIMKLSAAIFVIGAPFVIRALRDDEQEKA